MNNINNINKTDNNMEKKKNYYVPDLQICEFGVDSGFAGSATVQSYDTIETWASSEEDNDWFN